MNYFSWKNLSSKLGNGQIDEVPASKSVMSTNAKTVMSCDEEFSLNPDQASQTLPVESSKVHCRSEMQLKVRTIDVLTPDMTPHNAIFLCSFANPVTGSNFIAYSLNECITEALVRVYIASLHYRNGIYSVSITAPSVGWLPALSHIMRDAAGDNTLCINNTLLNNYYLIDLDPQILTSIYMANHSTIDLDRDSVTHLMTWQGYSLGSAIEQFEMVPEKNLFFEATAMNTVAGLESQVCESASTSNLISDADSEECRLGSVYSPEAVNIAPIELASLSDDDKLLNIISCREGHDDIEDELLSIVHLSDSLERHFQTTIKQIERQNSIQNQLLDKERNLIERERQLAHSNEVFNQERQRLETLNSNLIGHEADLKDLEVRLAKRETELLKGYDQLKVSRTALSDVMKKINSSMQRNSEQLSDPMGAMVRLG